MSRQRSLSTKSGSSAQMRQTPPPVSLTPENNEKDLEPCAATASFLLYAQRNQILVLHHDTLSIERRFELHREDIQWIVVDNVSDRGSGRLAVSFDVGKTAIVWDILSGSEVARFSAYEHMRTACFMRNGNIAFANDQGNIILFEPSTSEHISARTIFDPITAIAPAADCRTFAIGYLNGSILIATLQPSFTILHTLNTNRSPARITGLAWHGSSSKQRTDMLATQTSDGDLRVWSVPKQPHSEGPNIIRVLQRPEMQQFGPCWFAWSKNGRIVQHCDNETRSWDVRTKKVTYDVIPTVEGITGLAIYGATATLFTLSRNHSVYQYDINPSGTPTQVANAQHAPANTPPTPPTMLEENKNPYNDPLKEGSRQVPLMYSETESSADESAALSPLQKIAREMDSLDALESELRDKVMPLSPRSSQASSVSSKGSGRHRGRKYLYDRPDSSRASTSTGMDGTEFSFGPAPKLGHESMSIRSVSSLASQSQARHTRRTSNLRKEVTRSPQETTDTATLDLFPCTKARLREVAFRTPHYGSSARTADLLQREMLSVIFGWNDDVRSLIQDEMSRHRPGSASSVLLAKWLGDIAADNMTSLVGSESMTSSDWMLLALSSIGADSQKKVGEAFVQRLLEKGDIHPAVAILLGLGENNDAIEVYVSQSYYMEAVLLTCLTCPSDWQRTSYMIRKWGEAAVTAGQAELAVRCFSCTSIETTEPWFSPRAQDAVYAAQQAAFMQPDSAGGMTSPPLSPPSRSGSGRIKNASLKLITSFGDKGAPMQSKGEEPTTTRPITTAIGVTPIAQSALSPGGIQPWRTARDPSTARTATPGGFVRKKRLPSRSDIERAKQEAREMATPITAARDNGSRAPSRTRRAASVASSSHEPTTAVKASAYGATISAPQENDLEQSPSTRHGASSRLRGDSVSRDSSERKLGALSVQVFDTKHSGAVSPGPSTNASGTSSRQEALSPGPLTGGSLKSSKGRAINEFISSVEEARTVAREERAQSRKRNESRKRGESRSGRASSRMRDPSETRGRGNVKAIKPAKQSPSSPIPMSPEEIAEVSATHTQTLEPLPIQPMVVEPASTDDENFYKVSVTSPTGSHKSGKSYRSHKSHKSLGMGERRLTEKSALINSLAPLQLSDKRGRSQERSIAAAPRSPSLPMLSSKRFGDSAQDNDARSDGRAFRFRARSSSRQPTEDLQARRFASRDRREQSARAIPIDEDPAASSVSKSSAGASLDAGSAISMSPGSVRPRTLTRKQIAAQELEARRQSLARRPSAPAIPLPGELNGRPGLGPRSQTDLGDSPTSFQSPLLRSHTVDPEAMARYNGNGKISGMSTTSTPIGLPATPRAMRHPRYMSADPNERDGAPPVPEIPGKFSELSSVGSSTLSQVTGSSLSQVSSGHSSEHQASLLSENSDAIGPLLPSTVYGQKAPLRASSAPPEKQGGQVHPLYKPGLSSNRRLSASRGQVRKIPPPDNGTTGDVMGPTSIDAALHGDNQVVIIPEDEAYALPAVLPELQHLAGPPPPPPPPPMFQSTQGNSSGVINIAIDDNAPTDAIDSQGPMLPTSLERAQTASPSTHRKNAPSNDSFGSRFRGLGDRMRSSSKSRTKSPVTDYRPLPYETVLQPTSMAHPHVRHGSFAERAKSPYELAVAAQAGEEMSIPPPPPPAPMHGQEPRINETAIPPSSLPNRSQSSTGYRNPREIRANMPPETLQQGVYNGGFL